MPEIESYAPGTPCWVDVVSRDVETSAAFYQELFRWELGLTDGGFGLFTLDGLVVAGIGPCQSEQAPVWSTYVSVTDADGTVEAAVKAGGQILMAPVDIPAAGRGAAIVDPAGGVISLWQPGYHIGARVIDEAGARCWSELITSDVVGARDFYSEVFGWSISSADMSGTEYSVATVDGQGVAGLVQPPVEVGLPTHWSVTFAVADCEDALATVRRHNGIVAIDLTEIAGVGRFAAVAAPGGENFSILERAVAAPASSVTD